MALQREPEMIVAHDGDKGFPVDPVAAVRAPAAFSR